MKKGKRLKEIKSSSILKTIKIVLFFTIIILMLTGAYIIVPKQIKTNNKTETDETKKEFEIENIGDIEFNNANIQIKDNMSYISIDIFNNSENEIEEQKITIKVIDGDVEREYLYKIPKMNSKNSYKVSLITTGNLVNCKQIKIENIKIK